MVTSTLFSRARSRESTLSRPRPRQRPDSRLGRIGRNRRGVMQWISQELIVGMVIVALIIIIGTTFGVKIYNAVFGTNDERLMKNQFDALNLKIARVLNDPRDVVTDFAIMQQPSDGGFMILGFDSGATTFPITFSKSPTAQTHPLPRPGAEFCPTTLEACLCLYRVEDLAAWFGGNLPADKLAPVACQSYGAETMFSGRVSMTYQLSGVLKTLISLGNGLGGNAGSGQQQTGQPTTGTFTSWGSKYQSSQDFAAFAPYADLRLHNPITGVQDYYTVFVIGQDTNAPLKELYIEKTLVNVPDGNGGTRARNYVFVADYTPGLERRTDALHQCPLSSDKPECSLKQVGGIIDYLCPYGKATCAYDGTTGMCAPNCITACIPDPSAITSAVSISVPCGCAGQVEVEGWCNITDRTSNTEKYTPPACLSGDITKPCICDGDSVRTSGTCTVTTDSSGKTTYVYSATS